jgi:uncharacterized protein (DUF4415 family)
MTSENIRRASLAELREMKNRGEVRRGTPRTDDDVLPSEFWEAAEIVSPPRISVHLKLDPEVFEFFKQGGKGHLTRMQNVPCGLCPGPEGALPLSDPSQSSRACRTRTIRTSPAPSTA